MSEIQSRCEEYIFCHGRAIAYISAKNRSCSGYTSWRPTGPPTLDAKVSQLSPPLIQRPVLDCISGRASKLIGGVAPGILRPRAYEPEMLKERSSAPGTRAESIPDASPRAARTCAISRRHTEIFEGEECVFSWSFRGRGSGSVVSELAERIAPDARNAARGSSAVSATCRAVSSGLS